MWSATWINALIGLTYLRSSLASPIGALEIDPEEIARNVDWGNDTLERRDTHKFLASWSTATLSIPGGSTSGNTNVYTEGFSILNSAGKVIYTANYPDDHASCYHDGCRAFTVETPCFDGLGYTFRCNANFDGTPHICGVLAGTGQVLGKNNGNTKFDFYGSFISTKGYCAVAFTVPASEICGPNQPVKIVNSHSIGDSPNNCNF